MKHPNQEQWMDYLYQELPADQRPELDQHLAACEECRAQVDEWRESMSAMDTWKLPAAPARPRQSVARPWWQWAAAAAVVLGVGFGLGRFATPQPDLQALARQMEPQLRQQMKQEFAAMTVSYRTEIQKAVADLSAAGESQRATDRRAVVGLLKEQEALRRADFAELRRDLETVAVLTDGGLRKAQDQIVRLASLAQADIPADK